MDRPPKILSLMEDYMGHRTYSNLLREGFSQSPGCSIDFYWYNEERELDTRILRRLLSFSLPNQWIRKQNLDFRWFRGQIANAHIARRLALKKLRKTQYSALHFHTYVLAFLSLDLMKQLPTVVSLDMTSWQSSQEKADPQFRWTYHPNVWLGKQVFNAAARIVTRSEWARQSVIADYGIAPEKVKVVHPGVDTMKLTPPDALSRDPQQRFNMLFVGGDFERKGGLDVLDVFLQSFSEQAELHLVTRAPVPRQHPNLHIHPAVKAYSPKWLELYRQADVFVMPTHFEGFGWVFIEAMAAGLPVIATRINAIPEMVSHGKTGFLIQPGDRLDLADKIRTLMENPTLGRQMGMNGRKVVEQTFNAQTHCQTLASVFKDALVL
ncbi:MAG: glycosyltransferase family 4 protein [Pseudanabaenales cyanobacterium]|nr:glycosyltransferase family 4 protein [Pseudanabaenales cyanobacterium]